MKLPMRPAFGPATCSDGHYAWQTKDGEAGSVTLKFDVPRDGSTSSSAASRETPPRRRGCSRSTRGKKAAPRAERAGIRVGMGDMAGGRRTEEGNARRIELSSSRRGAAVDVVMVTTDPAWTPARFGTANEVAAARGTSSAPIPCSSSSPPAVTFYGMATFEGPLLAIKSVNALGHYTDWIIGHVHAGTLGWNGFMAAGMIYWLLPRLWSKPLYSTSLANLHFWLGTVGILLYVAAMWTSGITQGADAQRHHRPRHRPRVSQLSRYAQHHPPAHAHARDRRRALSHRLVPSRLQLLADRPRRASRSTAPSRFSPTTHPARRRRLGVLGTFFNRPHAVRGPRHRLRHVWMLGTDLVSVAGLVGALVCFVAGYALTRVPRPGLGRLV